jgi:glycosyltransferase involved in cell wall biosynthesis
LKVSICTLTFNSEKTIKALLEQVSKLNTEIIVVDSGSSDKTLEIVQQYTDVHLYHNAYKYHSNQMNYATSLATNDWVLCLDSDEIPSDEFIKNFLSLTQTFDFEHSTQVGRIHRQWIVLGRPVHAMYPCSSPDFVTRFYNKRQSAFNDRVVDDKVLGFNEGVDDFVLKGEVKHFTFETPEAIERKLQSYVNRSKTMVKKRSKIRGIISAFGALFKWYFVKKSFLDGKVGLQTTWYAMRYSYYKYQ